MRAADRADAQDAFMSGDTPLIVATNAFGTGIDKPDIRTVIHYDLPRIIGRVLPGIRPRRTGRQAGGLHPVVSAERPRPAALFMAGRYPAAEDFSALVTALRAASASDEQTIEEIRAAMPGVSASKLRVMLIVLKQASLIRERRGSRYVPNPALCSSSVELLAAEYEERRQRDQAKLEQMVIYAQTALCRTRVLLEALGESVEWPQCGTCDNCRGQSIRPEGSAQGAA